MPFERDRDDEIREDEGEDELIEVIVPNFPGKKHHPQYEFDNRQKRAPNHALQKQASKRNRARRIC